jgi:hypothetical protein
MFEVDEDVLMNINENEVFILDMRGICPSSCVRYFRNRMKDLPISMCNQCFKFFNTVKNYSFRKNMRTAS